MLDPQRLRLCVITDRRLARGRATATVVRQALAGGAPMILLREKELPTRELFELALELRRITREAGALFIVNDRADVAASFEEAEERLLGSHASAVAGFEVGHPRITTTLERLVELYRAWGKPGVSERYVALLDQQRAEAVD